ncbi:hypothetical protein BUALT_Bualt08G0107800 [Buddleja alternifolia]|uniref:Peptidase A1 domain-containing protein n=1 Tax=Buddleja alternifolia TaxID=168488 RepID=A0AAV6XBW4_9LAMI|nr:hypothetical protein BUALT_Bualt08G0107800 [Buddleja alternifolia]
MHVVKLMNDVSRFMLDVSHFMLDVVNDVSRFMLDVVNDVSRFMLDVVNDRLKQERRERILDAHHRKQFVLSLAAGACEESQRKLNEEEELAREVGEEVRKAFPDLCNEKSLVFYAVIEVGEPPRSFYLLHDTGSHLSWFQCPVPGAREGFHPPYETHNNFVPKSDPYCPSDSNFASNQLQVDKCECSVRYGDDSLFSGWLVRDKFLLRDMDMKTYQPSIVFGCGNLETDNVREPKSDGLLGLDRSELSVPSQLKHLGLTDNVHGHCLSRHGTGYGFFGGDFAQLPDDIVWLTMKPRNDDYTVESATLIIDGKPEKLGEVVFDSGTPYTYFNSRAYQAVYAMVKKSLRKSPLFPAKDDFLSHCWRGDKGFISVDEVKHYFEPITLHFPENIIILQPEDYLVDSVSE